MLRPLLGSRGALVSRTGGLRNNGTSTRHPSTGAAAASATAIHCNPSTGTNTNTTAAGKGAASPLVVDMHSHFLPREWPDFQKRFGGDDWCGLVLVLLLVLWCSY
jgi:hypothetical protein